MAEHLRGHFAREGAKFNLLQKLAYGLVIFLALPLMILGFSAIASVIPAGTAATGNPGPHGFSEILYAFTSATANNGSALPSVSRSAR